MASSTRFPLLLLSVLLPASAASDGTCTLPPCDLVARSRLHSPRCASPGVGDPFPLLVTGTPRSGTVRTTDEMRAHGAAVQNDWTDPGADGAVSWIFAFEDDANFGPSRTRGRRFERVLHQTREALESVTSMCTEPVLTAERPFLKRHIPMEEGAEPSRAALEFYVEWQEFLVALKLPRYRVEDADTEDLFRAAGLEKKYHRSLRTNARDHRPAFSWRELYTIDPFLAARAWTLAHSYGYAYPDVDFATLTCMDYLPTCDGKGQGERVVSSKCPPGTRVPTNLEKVVLAKDVEGWTGWSDGGCKEEKGSDGAYVGVRAVGMLKSNDGGTTGE